MSSWSGLGRWKAKSLVILVIGIILACGITIVPSSGAIPTGQRFLIKSWLAADSQGLPIVWMEIYLVGAENVTGFMVALDYDPDQFSYGQQYVFNDNLPLDFPLLNNLDKDNENGKPDRVVVGALTTKGQAISGEQVWLVRIRFNLLEEGLGTIQPVVQQVYGETSGTPQVWPTEWQYFVGGPIDNQLAAAWPDPISLDAPLNLLGSGPAGTSWQISIIGPGGWPGFPGRQAVTVLDSPQAQLTWPAEQAVLPNGEYHVNVAALKGGQTVNQWQLPVMTAGELPLEIEDLVVMPPQTGSGAVDVDAQLFNRGPRRQVLVLLVVRHAEWLPAMIASSWIDVGGYGRQNFHLQGQLPPAALGLPDQEVSLLLWSDWAASGGIPLARPAARPLQ